MNSIATHQAPQGNSNNPFGGNALAQRPASNAVAEAGMQREIAEVQAAMVIAKRFPRDPITAMDRILQACTRPSLAEGALYKHVRANLGEELSVALRKHHDLQVPKHQAISAYERPCESGNQRQMTKSQSRRRRGYMRFSHLSAARL